MVFRGICAGICHGLWRLVPDCSGSYSTRDRNTRCEILTRSMIIYKAANPKIGGFILSKYENSRVNFYTDHLKIQSRIHKMYNIKTTPTFSCNKRIGCLWHRQIRFCRGCLLSQIGIMAVL